MAAHTISPPEHAEHEQGDKQGEADALNKAAVEGNQRHRGEYSKSDPESGPAFVEFPPKMFESADTQGGTVRASSRTFRCSR